MIINVIDDKLITNIHNYRNWTTDQYSVFRFQEIDYKDEIVIAPAAFEHYNLFEYLKLKIHCDRLGVKIIGFGPLNQFPYLSIFCHEASMVENKLSFYDGDFTEVGAGSENIKNDPKFCNVLRRSHQCLPIFKDAQNLVSNKEAADVFCDLSISIRKSSYDSYLTLKDNYLPDNRISCQISTTCGPGPIGIALTNQIIKEREKFKLEFFNTGYDECRQHLLKVGHHFMSHQILLSLLSNWYFISCGGGASLLSLIPTKLLCALDRNYNNVESLTDETRQHYKQVGETNRDIVRQLYVNRFGDIGRIMPCLSLKEFNANLANQMIEASSNYSAELYFNRIKEIKL